MSRAFDRHISYYLTLARENEENWQLIEREWFQFHHAWEEISKRDRGKPKESLEALTIDYVVILHDFLLSRGFWKDAAKWIERALEAAAFLKDREAEASLLNAKGFLSSSLENPQKAIPCYQQAISIFRDIADKEGEATSLNNIEAALYASGNLQEALEHYEHGQLISQQAGLPNGEATASLNIGLIHQNLGDQQKALAFYNQALPIYQEMKDCEGEATVVSNIGHVYQ